MARIRTLKPEFPHSESMGHVSRDARLTFILMWTLADDSGRLRGNSRMLASLLFPYDDDATGLIEGWLTELEGEGCIIRYSADGTTYAQICNWLKHQKIDKPSASKLPPFDESSRTVANPLEHSSGDQGSRTGIKDQGSTDMSDTKQPDDVVTVFDHWRETHNHPGAKLDDKRHALIRKARKTYSAAELCRSITGYRNSPHHMGQNDSNTKYDSIEVMLKDAKQIDAGLKFHLEPPKPPTSGKPGAAPAPNNDAAWAEAKARAKAVGFRDPHSTESVSVYMTSVKLEETRPLETPLAERLGLRGIKRIGAVV